MTTFTRFPKLVTSRRRVLGLGLAGVAAFSVRPARAADVVRIGVPTKTYYPTIIAETAIRQKLFDKEGIAAELTIYRGGAEGYEAMAAGAADVIMNSASSVAAGLTESAAAPARPSPRTRRREITSFGNRVKVVMSFLRWRGAVPDCPVLLSTAAP